MIDHIGQLKALQDFKGVAGFEAGIFIKVDCGYGRAGLQPHSYALHRLLREILSGKGSERCGFLHGFYSHAGHSYGVDSPAAAMDHLSEELDGLMKAALLAEAITTDPDLPTASKPKLVVSVGATPSATSVQNLIHDGLASEGVKAASIRLRGSINQANASHHVELHAGVYPCLDMQQLATHASPSSDDLSKRISFTDLALTILVEVASLYDDRKPPEALIAAGSLALGREPCKSYKGWGVVSNWGMISTATKETGCSDWEVARVSQEHGVLQKVSTSVSKQLEIGQKVRIWPNHACIAGAGFGHYLVVDSDLPADRTDEIVDIWVRCQGW
jgi:D-serine deaminase-like pyridoxal phosphate-dependent protein